MGTLKELSFVWERFKRAHILKRGEKAWIFTKR